MTNVFISPHMLISIDESRKLLEWRWTSHFAPSKQLRSMLQDLCPALRTIGVRRWLLDHTHMKVVGPEDQDWIVCTWLPSWVQSVRPDARCRVAVVQSRDHFGKLSTLRIVNRVMERVNDLSVMVFDDVGAAETWLTRPETAASNHGGAST